MSFKEFEPGRVMFSFKKESKIVPFSAKTCLQLNHWQKLLPDLKKEYEKEKTINISLHINPHPAKNTKSKLKSCCFSWIVTVLSSQ